MEQTEKIVLDQAEAQKIADDIVQMALEDPSQNVLNFYGGCLLAGMTLAFATLSMGTNPEELEKNKQTFSQMMSDVVKMIDRFDEAQSEEMRQILKEFFPAHLQTSGKIH
jgi:hypothetical protein